MIGTGIITLEKQCSCVFGLGEDTNQLGRWDWIRYRGNGGITLRAIREYIPNQPTVKSEIYSEYSQE